ncbi:MAG: hypothetical protein DDT31_00733 [Syntrophomonadaceae bacterium]|nr:hypothetical protein [Bacillota bacterium]
MTVSVCKIEPTAPFHLGIKEDVLEKTSEYVHSDTLFSAICSSFRLLYGNDELVKMLGSFENGMPPFLISSAFPYINDVLLFPLPKHMDLSRYSEDWKKFKKAEFVSYELFKNILNDEDLDGHVKEDGLIQDKRVLLTGEEISKIKTKKIWNKKETPRVVVDRETSASQIYHFGEVAYSKGCGLHFLIDFKDRGFNEKVRAAIRLLSDEGIGGDRTYGKGLFKKPEFAELDINLAPKEHFVTLSLYYPQKEEISKLSRRYYELTSRGGWMYSPVAQNLRRKTIRMFVEGSVFKAQEGTYGCLKSVKPDVFKDHNVFRYGYAFAVPLEVRE